MEINIELAKNELEDISEKEVRIVNITFAAVNALFAKLDEEWLKFPEDETIELTDLFVNIGSHLVSYIDSYAKELDDTNIELIQAFLYGIVSTLFELEITDKKDLKEFIFEISNHRRKNVKV